MILTAAQADKKLRRMALEIAERNAGRTELIIIGIKENGIFIAKKIEEYLQPVFSGTIKTIALTINKRDPGSITLSEEAELKGKLILLADDVANSGRTMLYALRPLLDQYPAQVETLALVERTYKTFPIALNYIGLSVSTAADENIVVKVEEGIIVGAEIFPRKQ